MQGRRWIWIAGLAGAVIALALLALAASGTLYERQGPASVPYNAGEVEKVRVLDAFTVYVDGEPHITFTMIGATALLMLATAALMTALALHIAGAWRRPIVFYSMVAAGLTFAALDELLALHETAGHNLRFLADVPGASRPDDVVIALYLVPIAAFGYAFRDMFRADRRAMAAFAAGAGFFALSAAADLASLRAEEWFELLAGICIAVGLIVLIHHHLRRNLRISVKAVDRAPAPEAEPAQPLQPAGTRR